MSAMNRLPSGAAPITRPQRQYRCDCCGRQRNDAICLQPYCLFAHGLLTMHPTFLLRIRPFIARAAAGVALFPLLLVLLASPATAASLRIGVAADITSLDPHYVNIAPNIALATHCFDTLVRIDANGRLVPGLAVSWKAVTPTEWEFQLRPGVRFHDGSPFTAADVVFSLQRPATLTTSPGPFTSYTRTITGMRIVNATTVRLQTAQPYGPLPLDLASIFIVSKKAAEKATTEDFNSGRALIGSGPFRFKAFRRGEQVELERYPDYWGPRPAWDSVTLRIMPAPASRVAALLAGDVDVIEAVPPADVSRLSKDARFRLEQKVSWRTLLLQFAQQDAIPEGMSSNDGKPLARNPLRDARVRTALSLAINRPALTSRVLQGLATPAAQLVAPGMLGHDGALAPERYDPEAAKRLLAAAGYPAGFHLTLYGPGNRYINDTQVLQALAQFWSRIGVRTEVRVLPVSTYFAQARQGRFGVALLGWGSLAGDFALRSLVGTVSDSSGWGSWNWGHYSNTTLDTQIGSALGSVDVAKRETAARQAMKTAMLDHAAVPLYHQYATWAMRKNLRYAARTDEFTLAEGFAPVP